MEEIGIIKKFSKALPPAFSKSFMRPELNYSDVIYDQPNNESLNQNIETIQYNVALAITVTIEVTSVSKLYNELCFESFKFRRWFGKLRTFYKIKTIGVPKHLFDLTLITSLYSRTDLYKYSFFPNAILEWNKLVKNIQESKTVMAFINSLTKDWPADSKTYL